MEVNEREDNDCVYSVHLQVLVFTASAPLFRFDSFDSFLFIFIFQLDFDFFDKMKRCLAPPIYVSAAVLSHRVYPAFS